MINIPAAAMAFGIGLMILSALLAGENTLISAEVLNTQSGASTLSSAVIAIACTAIEIAFTSWVFQGRSGVEVVREIKRTNAKALPRILFGTAVLICVYDFDIRTTNMHPSFEGADPYFFVAVVGAYVFGPEILINIGWWLRNRGQAEETKYLAETNHRAAENEFRRTERNRLKAQARVAGKAVADRRAAERWGPGSSADTRSEI
ncbi:MAG: hypothetical protein AAFQ63_09040 [Cyanobacteria bacterium J06621_11]